MKIYLLLIQVIFQTAARCFNTIEMRGDEMNILLKVVAVLFAMAMLSSFATAHSGGTNKDGCHNNHKTGGYHCH